MSAHPKNKITSVERGKRRHGNTPKLRVDVKMHTIPLHKRTLFSKILRLLGDPSKVATDKAATPEKKKAAATNAGSMPGVSPVGPRSNRQALPVKKSTRTQHKGG